MNARYLIQALRSQVVEQIDALDLKSQLVATPQSLKIPRYIYYPDHLVDVTSPQFEPFRDPVGTLVSLVMKLQNILAEPLYKGLLPSMWNALFSPRPSGRPDHGKPGELPVVGQRDVSIGDFFMRRFGRRDLVDNIFSALAHGTQGGDVWKLSIESSMFQRLMVHESIGSIPGTSLALVNDVHLLNDIAGNNEAVRKLAEDSVNWGFLSFDGGFSTLTDALAAELTRNPNVTILLNKPVEHLRRHQTQTIEVCWLPRCIIGYYLKTCIV